MTMAAIGVYAVMFEPVSMTVNEPQAHRVAKVGVREQAHRPPGAMVLQARVC